MPPEAELNALSYGLVLLFSITLLAILLISVRKETQRDQSLKGVIWFTLFIMGFCTVIALLAAYVQQTRSLEKSLTPYQQQITVRRKVDCIAVKNLALLGIGYVFAGKNLFGRVVPAFAVGQLGGVENLILAK